METSHIISRQVTNRSFNLLHSIPDRFRLSSASDEEDGYTMDEDFSEHLHYMAARERLQEFSGRIPPRKKKETSSSQPEKKSRVSTAFQLLNNTRQKTKQNKRKHRIARKAITVHRCGLAFIYSCMFAALRRQNKTTKKYQFLRKKNPVN